jgi:hypothetical protein
MSMILHTFHLRYSFINYNPNLMHYFYKKKCVVLFYRGGMRWRSWLRHCASNRKVAGSIPDGVIGICHWHNHSGWADNLTTFMCQLSWNLGALPSWNTQGLSRPVMGLLYLLLFCSTTEYFRAQCTLHQNCTDYTASRLGSNMNISVFECNNRIHE